MIETIKVSGVRVGNWSRWNDVSLLLLFAVQLRVSFFFLFYIYIFFLLDGDSNGNENDNKGRPRFFEFDFLIIKPKNIKIWMMIMEEFNSVGFQQLETVITLKKIAVNLLLSTWKCSGGCLQQSSCKKSWMKPTASTSTRFETLESLALSPINWIDLVN